MPDLDGAFLTPEQQWAQDKAELGAENLARFAHAMDPHGDLDAHIIGTPLADEFPRFAAGEPFRVMPIAGLQYGDYDRPGLDGAPRIPRAGDRLQLVRNPRNGADANAIEVHWRNEHRLGHVPRGHARHLASALDEGQAARAYVIDPGNGRAWSASLVIVGAAAAALPPNPGRPRQVPVAPPRPFVPGRLGVDYDLADEIPF